MFAHYMRSNLDILRVVAILLVLAYHMDYAPAELGRLGVLLFFVHTCVVLMMSLERHGADAVKFYVRRAFRIYPLSVVLIAVVVIFHLPPTNYPGVHFVAPTAR